MLPLILNSPLAQHMGRLHPYENLLVVAIAFGPFVLLGIVVFVVRRRDLADLDDEQPSPPDEGEGQTDTATEVSPDRPPTT